MRPNFEEPLDTAKQLVENNITIYMGPFASGWRELMQESNITEYMILGENLVYAKDNDQFYEIAEHDVLGKGTHAQLISYLMPYELELGKKLNSGRGWYRSKERFPDDPYFGFLSNRKWHFNEVITSN